MSTAFELAERFNKRNRNITETLLQQGRLYQKLRKTFSKFYHRNIQFISKCNLKALLQPVISHPKFYGDVIYELRKIFGYGYFKIVCPKRIEITIKSGYDPVILQRTACLLSVFYSWQSRLPLLFCDDRTD